MKEKVVKLAGIEYDRSKYLYYVGKDKEDGEVYVFRTPLNRRGRRKKDDN